MRRSLQRTARQHVLLEEKNRSEAVRRAVLALPQRYREPVVLYYFHEMDVDTAAQTLKMPTGTLKARLARGRALLKTAVSAARGGGGRRGGVAWRI